MLAVIDKLIKEDKALELKAMEQRAAIKVYSDSVRLRFRAETELQKTLNTQKIKEQLRNDLYKRMQDLTSD